MTATSLPIPGVTRSWIRRNVYSRGEADATFATLADVGSLAIADLFAGIGPTLWLSARDPTLGLPILRSTRTGGKVSALADLSGNGHAVGQGTSTSQPVLGRSDGKANLLANALTMAGWVKTGASVTSGAGTGPFGTASTAEKLVEDTSTGGHYATPSGGGSYPTVPAGAALRQIVRLKAGERTKCRVRLTNQAATNWVEWDVDLSSGATSNKTVTGTVTGETISTGANGLASGWWDVDIAATLAAADADCRPRVALLDGSGNASYTGDGSSGLHFGGAAVMLADTVTLGDVVATGAERQPSGLGGRPGLSFDGANDFLAVTGATDIRNLYAGGAWCCMVLRPHLLNASQLLFGATSGGGTYSGMLLSATSSTSAARPWFLQNATGGTNSWFYGDTLPLYEPGILDWSFDSGSMASPPVVSVNGRRMALTSSTVPGGTPSDEGAFDLHLGAKDNGAYPFMGEIGELLVFADEPDALAKSAVRAWLAGEYGVTLA